MTSHSLALFSPLTNPRHLEQMESIESPSSQAANSESAAKGWVSDVSGAPDAKKQSTLETSKNYSS